MACQNNLQDQLRFLSQNLKKCQFSGFQYAPTASEDVDVPAVFNFDTSRSISGRNSSKQSVSDVGFLDLQTFRNERTEIAAAQQSTSARPSFETSNQAPVALSRHTAVSAYVAPVVSVPVYPALPAESTFLDSELMNLDIEALIAAELAKQEAAKSSAGNVPSAVAPVAQPPSNFTLQSSARVQVVNISSSSSSNSSSAGGYNDRRSDPGSDDIVILSQPPAQPPALTPAQQRQQQQELDQAQQSLQKVQRDLDRLTGDLSAVNAQLTAGWQQGSAKQSTAALRKQRDTIENALEELAQEQQRLQEKLSSVKSGSAGPGGSDSSKENHYGNAGPLRAGGFGGTVPLGSAVVDLLSADRVGGGIGGRAAWDPGASRPAVYSVASSSGGGGYSSHAAGAMGSGGGAGSGSAGSSTSQLSPQLASMSRLAGVTAGSGTPVAANSSSSGAMVYQPSSYGGAAGGGYNQPSSYGYGSSTALFSAGTGSTSSSGAAYGGGAYTGSAQSGAYNASSNLNTSSGGYVSHSMGASAVVVPSSGASAWGNASKNKASNFADDFSQDFEDAVNDNDFTDWVGADAGGYGGEGGEYGGGGGGGGYQGSDGGGGGYSGGAAYAGSGSGGGSGGGYNFVTNTELIPQCHCGNVSIMCTSRQDASNGLKFFCCAYPRTSELRCAFFQWEDPSQAPESRTYSSSGVAVNVGAAKDHKVEIRQRFGHVGFRQGQLECVEAAMAGRDVFCLMPTGGGKSVVYQLPAWCSPGVAVIFSPLISLIQDQVDSMLAIGIRAVFLSSTQDNNDVQLVIQELQGYCRGGGAGVEDESRIKMLYITPEKYSKSEQLNRLLKRLADARLLSRFIIDEAHCLSQWGHDFRPDYLNLKKLRSDFADVPLMALTATANNSVVQDVMRVLQMKNPFLHSQSFNRSNLRYSIRPKVSDKKVVQEIGEFVLKHRKQSGIIYCLSRKDTKQLAEELQSVIPAMKREITFYHADLTAQEKESRQRAWSKGDVKLICATIAFGMGINKPDVRYVIHHSLPKSLTNYYQESGRAGRDGETSHCILYYSFRDRTKLAHMIIKSAEERGYSAGSAENVKRSMDNLNKCVTYCIDEVQCRRVMLLEYFGEAFPKSQCDGTCDNCLYYKTTHAAPPTPQDLTLHAKALLHILRHADTLGQRVTLLKLGAYYARSKDKETTKFADILGKMNYSQFPELANPKEPLVLSKDLTERLLQHLVLEDYLQETHIANFGNYGADYIIEGSKGKLLLKPPATGMQRYGYSVTNPANEPVILLPTTRSRKAGKGGADFGMPDGQASRGSGYTASSAADEAEEQDWLDNTTALPVPAGKRASKGSKTAAGRAAPEKSKRSRKSGNVDIYVPDIALPPPAAAPPAARKAAAKASKAAPVSSAAGAAKKTAKQRTSHPPPPTEDVSDDGDTWMATSRGSAGSKTSSASSLFAASKPKGKAGAAAPAVAVELLESSDEDRVLPDLARQRSLQQKGNNTVSTAAAAQNGRRFQVPYKETRPPSPSFEDISSGESVGGAGRGRAQVKQSASTEEIFVESSDNSERLPVRSRLVPSSSGKSRRSVIALDDSTTASESEHSSAPTLPSMKDMRPPSGSAGQSAPPQPACLLSKRQQAAFKKWLEDYRKRWVSYWNYLSNSMVTEVVQRVPVTMEELALIQGMGATKARLNGEGILATIYAFLDKEDLLHLFPKASPPTLAECPTWRDPGSAEAEEIRQNADADNAAAANRRASYSQTQAANTFSYTYQDSSPPPQLHGSGKKSIGGDNQMLTVGAEIAAPAAATAWNFNPAPSAYADRPVAAAQAVPPGGIPPNPFAPSLAQKRPLSAAGPGSGAPYGMNPLGAAAVQHSSFGARVNAPPQQLQMSANRPPVPVSLHATPAGAGSGGYADQVQAKKARASYESTVQDNDFDPSDYLA